MLELLESWSDGSETQLLLHSSTPLLQLTSGRPYWTSAGHGGQATHRRQEASKPKQFKSDLLVEALDAFAERSLSFY